MDQGVITAVPGQGQTYSAAWYSFTGTQIMTLSNASPSTLSLLKSTVALDGNSSLGAGNNEPFLNGTIWGWKVIASTAQQGATLRVGAPSNTNDIQRWMDNGLTTTYSRIAYNGAAFFGISDTGTNAIANVTTFTHNSSGSITTNFGTGVLFQGQDSTTAAQDMVNIQSRWVVSTHASRRSMLAFQLVYNAGSLTDYMTLTPTQFTVNTSQTINAVAPQIFMTDSAQGHNTSWSVQSYGAGGTTFSRNNSGSILLSASPNLFSGNPAILGFGTINAADVVIGTNNTGRITISSTGNIGLSTTQFGSGVGVIGIADAGTLPTTNPTGGVVLYSDNGTLKVRDSAGNVKVMAPASALDFSYSAGFDSYPSALTAPDTIYKKVDRNCTITGWDLWGDAAGSGVIDVWYNASTLPTAADTITGTGTPTAVSAQTANGNTSAWTTVNLTKGGWLAYRLVSSSTFKRLQIQLQAVVR